MPLMYKEDWDEAKRRYQAWWNGEYFGRCGLAVTAPRDGIDADEPPPARPDTPEQRWTDLDYIRAADIGKSGSCHLFRHTAATLMLENGADIRFIQQMLGHVSLETTQIYTQVSIRRLKEVHTTTHPGARWGRLPKDE